MRGSGAARRGTRGEHQMKGMGQTARGKVDGRRGGEEGGGERKERALLSKESAATE